MEAPIGRSLYSPEQIVDLPFLHVDQVALSEMTVGLVVAQPGWRWSEHVRPQIGGEWCEVRHAGVVLSGRLAVVMRDGTTAEFGPYDAFEIPPGHDGYTVGDEPCVQIDWGGLRAFDVTRALGSPTSVLATLLFTDIVNSTETARRLGDRAWRELLSSHLTSSRTQLETHGGREINTTGDGLLATFDGPAAAIRAAIGIRKCAAREGIAVRVGVHVGEVELVGTDVRGIAVHEASRIMSAADPNEIVVSAITRALAGASGLRFEPKGEYELKGLDGTWELFSAVEPTKDIQLFDF